jgi:hypothetical protein
LSNADPFIRNPFILVQNVLHHLQRGSDDRSFVEAAPNRVLDSLSSWVKLEQSMKGEICIVHGFAGRADQELICLGRDRPDGRCQGLRNRWVPSVRRREGVDCRKSKKSKIQKKRG